MAARKKQEQKRRPKKSRPKDYVAVSSKSYGNALKGMRIYFEGKRPKALRDDGTISFGKHILETLNKRFDKFRWIITTDTDAIETERGIVRVRTSQKLLARMNRENWDRSRDIENDIVRRFFASAFPTHFQAAVTSTYVPGNLAVILDPKIVHRLSTEDKEALNAFLPEYVAAEAVGTVQNLNASAQIKTLKSLAEQFAEEMDRLHPESWWQTFIKSNILLMQQGYIKALDKLNIAVGQTKYPDYCLVTHDNYLDILEIKKPQTTLLKKDAGRGNFYWDAEIAKAISQTENYIEQVSSKAADLRSYLLDAEKLDVKAVRPRGIILAGDARGFGSHKERDDFRLLSQGLKNVTVLTYDELLTRLTNYIRVLQEFADQRSTTSKRARPNRRKGAELFGVSKH